MNKKENKNVLKGQQTIAQGKRRRSVALGWRARKEIVRARMFIKEHFFSRTKELVSCFPGNNAIQIRPRKVFLINYRILADGFHYTPFTQGDISVVPPETLPWAEISWPFRPGVSTKNEISIINSKHIQP